MHRRNLVASLAILLSASTFLGQTDKPAYLDTTLAPEKRAADLVSRLKLEEKASQMVNQSRAIPRLKIPAYDWWSEALHGVQADGVTEFPEPVGLAATFDPKSVQEMAHAIAIEGRIRHAKAEKEGHSNMMEGLDFWAPNVNIFRDPRWGRGQETYGEDPFLSARFGVAYVTGMQGNDPNYYLAISTPKHFAVHSGPEPSRHKDNFDVSKHDEVDTYLPAFRAAITEGKAGSIMCAYNRINGQPACASEFLLQDQLRGKWGFSGYVVSDCGAVTDIFENHHFTASQPEASALSVKRGMDNECVDFMKITDDHDYRAYIDAVKQGHLKESELDKALVRTFTARFRMGLFDPPSKAPFANPDPSLLESKEHRAIAHRLANESMVLLKNDGVLPLTKPGARIAVIGPLADETRVLLGNYNGHPTHTVSILEGMKAEFGEKNVLFSPGTTYLDDRYSPVPDSVLGGNEGRGFMVSYQFRKKSASPFAPPAEGAERIVEGGAVATIDPTKLTLPQPQEGERLFSITWKGELKVPESGTYNFGVFSTGPGSVKIDGKDIAHSPGWENFARLGSVALEAGRIVPLQVTYHLPEPGKTPSAQLVWVKPSSNMKEEALSAARSADVVVAVVGITSMLEGEEMQVNEPGFKGGDRTSLDLPKAEQELVEALAATGKPLVLVLTNGSALSINKESKLANAVLDAFYPGEEGGAAVAETLSGKNNPSGRLPITFYTGVDQLPSFDDYSMKGRTYRYFEGKPLFPFGHGLSYTTFRYRNLKLKNSTIHAGDALTAEVEITNTGKRAGDEVAQLYLKFPEVEGAPRKALRGFQRVHLNPGETRHVIFELKPRDLSMVTKDGDPTIASGKHQLFVGGGQPDTGAETQQVEFEIDGSLKLPE